MEGGISEKTTNEQQPSLGHDEDFLSQHNHPAYRDLSNSQASDFGQLRTSRTREEEHRLDDDLAVLQAEQAASDSRDALNPSASLAKSRSRRTEHVDEFDVNTNPVFEKTAIYSKLPEHPTSRLGHVFKAIHNSSFLVRYFMYIIPIAALLSIPLLIGAFVYGRDDKGVGGVELLWFSVWLEIVWLTLWAGRIVAKMIPWPLGLLSTLFTNNSKKWRDMAKQLELPLTLFFWCLGVEISFLPTMNNHRIPGYNGDPSWMTTINQIIVSIFVGAVLNLFEKIVIQLIAISFHLRTYSDRIEINKFQIGSLVKLYDYSKTKISLKDSDFEDDFGAQSGPGSGTRTPMQYVDKARRDFTSGFRKVGDVAGKVAGDFTGKQVTQSTHPHQVVLFLLGSNQGSQVLARRLYRTFIMGDLDTISPDDIKPAFEHDDEAEAAFTMFDKDLNGDISMEELETVCVEVGRERKSITASLKDLDSVVSKLDAVLVFIVICVTILVFITLISTSAAGVLTSAGSTVLALSWLFSATAQEFLQSLIFVFVKHPFDVGDRVSVYGNTGASMQGDDYFVKEISLLYTEFKKMEGHLVQAPNSYLNQLFILNQRRSGGLAEAVPLTIKFGTTLDQIDGLRARLLDFVKIEKREYQGNILTEIREIVEAHSINLNVVFFYKSNWQNEGLRLQRRHKFICAMMIAMQELDIEGPLMRLPGQKSGSPFYVQYPASMNPGSKPLENEDHGAFTVASNLEPTQELSGRGLRELQRGQSILRHPNSRQNVRPRGESMSSLAKRVDFSLGMKDAVAENIFGDVYDGALRPQRMPDILRTSASRTRGTSLDNSDEAASRSTAREDGSHPHPRFRQRHSSIEPQSARRVSSLIHRNRFFGRSDREAETDDSESLMERGMAAIPESSGMSTRMDQRSGTISPQAVRLDTHSTDNPSEASNAFQQSDSATIGETIEMRRII